MWRGLTDPDLVNMRNVIGATDHMDSVEATAAFNEEVRKMKHVCIRKCKERVDSSSSDNNVVSPDSTLSGMTKVGT